MSEADHTIRQKFWAPRLIELTTIGNPDVNSGEPTKCYVDPQTITLIYRGVGGYSKNLAPEFEGHPQYHERQICTLVCLRGGGPANILVTESCQEVAQRRDRALEVPVTLEEVK